MHKCFFPLLLALLLCGCASRQNPGEEIPRETTAESILSCLDASDGVTAYRINGSPVEGILPLGDGIVLLTAREQGTRLTGYPGERSLSLDFSLTAADCTVHSDGRSISVFDPVNHQTLVLDDSLSVTGQIPAPPDLVGKPVLSADQKVLYYSTNDAIRALERRSGISRLLQEGTYAGQMLERTLAEDRVLSIKCDGTIRFLSTQTGARLEEQPADVRVTSWESLYCAELSCGGVFGWEEEAPRLLLPRFPESRCCFLPAHQSAVTVLSRQNDTLADLYDLTTGLRTASMTLPEAAGNWQICADGRGCIWFLSVQGSLYSWDPAGSPVSDEKCYTGSYHTREEAGTENMDPILASAGQLAAEYGIEISIEPPAAEGYQLEAEYLAPVLQRELSALQTRLNRLPEGFLDAVMAPFSPLRISIVRALISTDTGQSLPGVLLRDGLTAHIVLAAGQDTEEALFRCLYLLAETTILNTSTAYDQWERLNPEVFSYYPSYGTHERMTGREWLTKENPAFLNAAAMRSPQEDRAELFGCAMGEGNGESFASAALQAKLRRLCAGLREGFDLDPRVQLPWEQYLQDW